MLGLGGAEILIILLIVALLFGPTLVAFWLGYTLGRKRTAETPASPETSAQPAASASASAETPAPVSPESSAPEEHLQHD